MKKDFRLVVETLEKKSCLSTVAILDSGTDIFHKDLVDNVWVNSGEIANNNIDDDNNGYVDDIHGWNFIDNTNNVMDVYGHGTHVAGIIQGTNPSVKLMTLKIINDKGVGSTEALLYALDYVNNIAAREDVAATNNSWSLGSYGSVLVKDRIQQLNDKNVLFVCAAGNYGSNIDINANYPSSFKLNNIVSVASIAPDNSLAISSNYGVNTVKVATYGTLIYSTWPGNKYGILSGTSMATPFIAGKLSLYDGSLNDKISSLSSSVIKTDSLADKVGFGGFLKVDTNFLPVASTPVVDTPPVTVTPKVFATISRASLSSVSGNVSHNQKLKIYVNNRFVGYSRITYSASLKTYKFSMVLGRKYFARGWNTVSVKDPVTGISLDSKSVKRII